jgi:DNA (cytosine-5)-methyltransferase 1
MKAVEVQKIGENKGKPRVWLQGKRPLKGGFLPGLLYCVKKDASKQMLTLELAENGDHVVCKKTNKDGTEIPIIDINSIESLGMFDGMEAVRVVIAERKIFILPLATEIRRKERLDFLKSTLEKDEPIKVGSVSHGMGVLSLALETGLAKAGVKSTLAFAIDIDGDALEHASNCNPVWNDDTIAVAAPLQEVVFDEYVMSKLPRVHLVEAGIPCTAASVAGRAKKGLAQPEDDPNVGHLMAAFISLIGRVQPSFVVLENVVPYQSSASMGIYRSMMSDMGYDVHERVLSGDEFGVLENRKRMVAIAVTRGIEFDVNDLIPPVEMRKQIKVGDILDDIPNDDTSWSSMQYLKDKEVRDMEAGKGFRMQVVTADSILVPTITRGYMKRRSTDPFLQHPENPDLLRLFTPAEHARIKGILESLVAGLSGTTAHQLLGQSILPVPFEFVGEKVGYSIMKFGRHGEVKYIPQVEQFELMAA